MLAYNLLCKRAFDPSGVSLLFRDNFPPGGDLEHVEPPNWGSTSLLLICSWELQENSPPQRRSRLLYAARCVEMQPNGPQPVPGFVVRIVSLKEQRIVQAILLLCLVPEWEVKAHESLRSNPGLSMNQRLLAMHGLSL